MPTSTSSASSAPSLRISLDPSERFRHLWDAVEAFSRETGISVETIALREAPDPSVDGEDGAEADVRWIPSRYLLSEAWGLLPLEELLDPAELSDFAAPALEMCRDEVDLGGSLLALPVAVETRILYFRTDIFENRQEQVWYREASGGRELAVPKTWEELALVAQHFTREGRMHGFAFPGAPGSLPGFFLSLMVSVGGALHDAEGELRLSSTAGEWALGLLCDLVGRWNVAPEETLELEDEDVSRLFRQGRAAMVCDHTGVSRLLRDPTFSSVAGWHSAAAWPSGADGLRAVWTECPGLAITRSCSDPASALQLILRLTSTELQRDAARFGAIPSRLSAYHLAREDLREGAFNHLRFMLAESTLRESRLTPPRMRRWPEIEAALALALTAALRGETEPAAALAEADRVIREITAVPSDAAGEASSADP